MVSITLASGNPVLIDMEMQPIPLLYMSSRVFTSMLLESILLTWYLFGSEFQERVLHLGHLVGVELVLENQEWPHARHEYVMDSPYQWYVPQCGQRAGLSTGLTHE